MYTPISYLLNENKVVVFDGPIYTFMYVHDSMPNMRAYR
jgi:hypothetical protein